MAKEYEVYSQTLEPFLGCVVCATEEAAKTLAKRVEAKSGIGFYVREVEVGKRPLPVQNPVTSPILVDEVRALMARHGQHCLVSVAWNAETGTVNIATAGSTALHSDLAARMGDDLIRVLGGDPTRKVSYEDRRHEHGGPPVPLSNPAA